MRGMVQVRDEAVMRVIYEEQFLPLSTISKYFFGDSLQSASLRVIKLMKMKLLKYETLSLPGKPKVARLTQGGVRYIRSVSPFELKQKRTVAISTYIHDATVSEVRLRLTNLFDASWIPEKALKIHFIKHIPDGILTFSSGKRIAIEVENTVKGSERYYQMWREWENQDFMLILYVATTDTVYHALEKRMSSFQSSKLRLGLIHFKSLLNEAPDSIWTPRGSIDLFSKRSF